MKRLKINLTLVNIWAFDTNTPHFGLMSLAAFLRNKLPCVDVHIIEGFDPLLKIVEGLPDIVGFTSDTIAFTKTLALANKLKKYLNVPFIIGGVHITAMPESFENVFDIGVVGEGEVTLTALLKIFLEESVFTRNRLGKIKGILFRDGDKVISTEFQGQIKELDDLPYPAWDLVPMEKVYLKDQLNIFGVKRVVSIMTSRGCPYNCIFCGSPVQWGGVRFHTAEYVLSEIEFLIKKYQIDGIMFWDDLFIAPKKRLIKLVKYIKEKGLDKKLVFFGYARANLIDEDVCQLLRSIRVQRLIFGLETGSERVLQYLKGGSVTVLDNERAVRLCRKYGIAISSGFITGSHGETLEELKKTYDFIRNNPLDNSHVYLLTPYPGTRLWEESKRMQMVSSEMNFSKLFVQLPSLELTSFFKKHNHSLIKNRIFLNAEYNNNKEYLGLIFKMQKLVFWQNLRFYLKTFSRDKTLIVKIFKMKIKIFLKKSKSYRTVVIREN